MATTWTIGDVSGSQTLSDNDHLYPDHVNELRQAINDVESAIDSLTIPVVDAGNFIKPATDGDEVRAYHSDGTSYVEVGNDGTDSKITSGTGHIVLTPASSKLVKLAVLQQDDTTNAYKNNTVILTGWGQMQGDTSIDLEESLTFGVTFSAAPIVLHSFAGYKTTSAATSIADFTNNVHNHGHVVVSSAKNVTTTGMTMALRVEAGGNNFSTSNYYGYSWIAIGVLA